MMLYELSTKYPSTIPWEKNQIQIHKYSLWWSVFSFRRKEVSQLPWVDSATHDQRLAGLPNPIAFIWDEVHPPQGPPGWDPIQYWAWENVRLLPTFIPARMKSAPDRPVVLMYKPFPACPPPMANPLGLRPRNLQYLLSYCCGGAQPNSCPVGERLVGCCSHCTTAICQQFTLLSQLYYQHLIEVFGCWTEKILSS